MLDLRGLRGGSRYARITFDTARKLRDGLNNVLDRIASDDPILAIHELLDGLE